ncbi:hypothetical protein BDW72DRAFT_93142 [Aspergillus terricola var. indicus]
MALGFLECRIVLPAYLPQQSPSQSRSGFTRSKHVINWIMVKAAKDQPGTHEEQQNLGSKIFFSTLEYAEIPESETELFYHCLQQLEQEWNSICDTAEEHLINLRTKTFDSSGQEPSMIAQHLTAATTWASFDATQTRQAKILQDLCKTYNKSTGPYLKCAWDDKVQETFQENIGEAYSRINKRIARLTQMSQELIDLVI